MYPYPPPVGVGLGLVYVRVTYAHTHTKRNHEHTIGQRTMNSSASAADNQHKVWEAGGQIIKSRTARRVADPQRKAWDP